MGFGKDGRGAIIRQHVDGVDVSTLGVETAQSILNLSGLTKDFRCLKMETLIYAEGMNQGDHLFVGWTDGHHDMTDVAETLQNAGPLGPHDTEEAMVSERRVEILGQMTYESGAAQDAQLPKSGLPLITNPRWTFREGLGIDFFVYNPDSGVAISATTYVSLYVKLYGVWIR